MPVAFRPGVFLDLGTNNARIGSPRDAQRDAHGVAHDRISQSMPSRVADLAELGLAPGEKDDGVIRKAFLRKTLQAHPDKGGSEEQFNALKNAYERLKTDPYAASAPPPHARQNSNQAGRSNRGGDYNWYDRAWARNQWRYSNSNFGRFHKTFQKREMTEKEKRERRAWFIKNHKDPHYPPRDKKAEPGEPSCIFCRLNRGITEEDATVKDKKMGMKGMRFDMYTCHPRGRITCWICLLRHETVMTKSMAMSTSWKDANGFRLGKVLEHRPNVFAQLTAERKTFKYQPVAERCRVPTRNSEYFWVEDLQEIAQELPAIQRKKAEVGGSIPAMDEGAPASPPRAKRQKVAQPITPDQSERRRVAADAAMRRGTR